MAASNSMPQDSRASHASEAVQWFLRARGGQLSENDRARFEAWHREPANAAAYAKARHVWSAVGEVAFEPEILRAREKIVAQLNRRRSYTTVAIAASVAAVIGVALLTNIAQPVIDRVHAWLSATPDYVSVAHATRVGERSTVTLSDGSILTLNTNSAAVVAFDEHERKITLTRGQALFEVAKNQNRPFVVDAGDRRVVATGTAFDVRVERSQVEVTLVEGRVLVGGLGNTSSRPAALRPGERLIAASGAVSIAAANVEQITSWTTGKLTFLDSRLDAAIEEMNRYTLTPIRLADPSLASLRVNGVFRAGQPAEFARAIAQIHRIDVAHDKDGALLIVARSID